MYTLQWSENDIFPNTKFEIVKLFSCVTTTSNGSDVTSLGIAPLSNRTLKLLQKTLPKQIMRTRVWNTPLPGR